MKHITLKSWGMQYSTEWSFMCIGKITKISIWHTTYITAIRFTCQDDDGTVSVSPKFGGSNGDYSEVNIDIEVEELNGISGTLAKPIPDWVAISSLSFSTNLHKFGPFGKEGDNDHFSLPITKARIAGFHGRAAACIHAIGVYLEPAN